MLTLVGIDYLFYPHPLFTPRYYTISVFNILAVLGLTAHPCFQRWLGRYFVPCAIALMSIAPIITTHLMMLALPPGSRTTAEITALRSMPVLFIALALTAWQYQWRAVVWFSGGTAALNWGLHYLFNRIRKPPAFFPTPLALSEGTTLLPPVMATLIQTISFLVVGYFICHLMTRLRQQQESLAQANAQLTHYASTLEHLTISRERNRLARELHDTLAHTLSGLAVQLETVKAYWDVDAVAAQKLLDKSLDATRSGLQETRRALKSLRASPLDDLGLTRAIRQLAEEAARRASLELDLTLSDELPALSPDVEQTLYRVAQEAIANVGHHAGAHNLIVQLTHDDNAILLLVHDDGRGFAPRRAPSDGHYGLVGMQERARLVGGKLIIESQPEQGTAIRLVIRKITTQPTLREGL